jgi:hypothetical protein
VGVQEVRWDKGCTEQAEDYIYAKENENHHVRDRIFFTSENSISS